MMATIFVDTNVLVYAYDRAEAQKQRQAIAVLDALALGSIGALSTQVLAEFYIAVTSRIAAPLTPAETYQRVSNYVQSWSIIELNSLIVLEAIRGVQQHQFSYWDAQIWAAARLNQLEVVFSEDFNTGSVIEGVHFVNPFAAGFRLNDWASL